MRHVFKLAGLAAVLCAGAVAVSETASAQGFSVRIGPDRDRVVERRVYREPRVIERRVIRPERTVCTVRVNRFGDRVRTCRSR
jgi:hypothetical protein